jgi:hypothetical protein
MLASLSMPIKRPRGNIPRNPRWTIESASREFATSPDTLKKALAQASITCGEDSCFSTAEISAAVFGSLYQEKLGTQKEIRRKLELENAVTMGNLLSRAALQESLAELADALGQSVLNSGLPREACANFLHNLSSWPLRLEEVAARQTRLPRGNGAQPDEG